MNYSGSDGLVRLFPLQLAQDSGALKGMVELADKCMADYDEDGWRCSDYRYSADISVFDRSLMAIPC